MKTSDSKRTKNLSINPSFLFLLSSLFVLLSPHNALGHIIFKLRGSTCFERAAAKSVASSPSTFFSGRNLIRYFYSKVLASKFLMSYSLNIDDLNKSS